MSNSFESLMIMMVVPGGYDDDDESSLTMMSHILMIFDSFKTFTTRPALACACACVDFGWLHIIFLSWFQLLQRWRIGDGEDLDAAAY